MPKDKQTKIQIRQAGEGTTAADQAFISKLNREHLKATEAIIRKMEEARALLPIPEPWNPLDTEDVDGIPTTDPKTGKFAMIERGSPEYEAYLQENAAAIRAHEEWEASPINAEFMDLRRELEALQRKYDADFTAYIDNLRQREAAPSIVTHFPTEYVAPTDIISNKIFSGEINLSRPENIRVNAPDARKPVYTTLTLDYEALEEDGAIRGSKQLDQYTRKVYDAIISIWKAGNTVFTVGMVYSVMTGSPEAKITPQHSRLIEESIRKLMKAVITIDATSESTMKNYGRMRASYTGNLLTVKGITIRIKGKLIDGAYQIYAAPILYEYANAKNEIARGDISMLNAPINKNPDNIILIGYLQRRVSMAEHNKNKETYRKIRYEAIYETIGISGSGDSIKTKKKRIRGYVKKILDYWKQQGFILNYSEYELNGRTAGIEIIPGGDQSRGAIPQGES